MKRHPMAPIVDIYVTSERWALPLVEDYLAQFGIDALVKTNAVSVYPMAVGPLSGFRVGVPADQAKVAAKLLAQAISDGVFPGEVTGGEGEGEARRSTGL